MSRIITAIIALPVLIASIWIKQLELLFVALAVAAGFNDGDAGSSSGGSDFGGGGSGGDFGGDGGGGDGGGGE